MVANPPRPYSRRDKRSNDVHSLTVHQRIQQQVQISDIAELCPNVAESNLSRLSRSTQVISKKNFEEKKHRTTTNSRQKPWKIMITWNQNERGHKDPQISLSRVMEHDSKSTVIPFVALSSRLSGLVLLLHGEMLYLALQDYFYRQSESNDSMLKRQQLLKYQH